MTRLILSVATIITLWLRAVTIPFVLILRNNEDYIINNALAEDQAWNALFAGEADESISARCHRCKWIRREKFINWLFSDDQHCRIVTYYLAYNPALGNAFAGCSEHELIATDGVVVEARGGDMPDLSRLFWNTATLMFDAKHVNIITKREFIKRLTATEYATIKSAATQSAELDYYWQMFMLADEINLEDIDTTRGVWMLELFGLIGTGRATEILV